MLSYDIGKNGMSRTIIVGKLVKLGHYWIGFVIYVIRRESHLLGIGAQKMGNLTSVKGLQSTGFQRSRRIMNFEDAKIHIVLIYCKLWLHLPLRKQ